MITHNENLNMNVIITYSEKMCNILRLFLSILRNKMKDYEIILAFFEVIHWDTMNLFITFTSSSINREFDMTKIFISYIKQSHICDHTLNNCFHIFCICYINERIEWWFISLVVQSSLWRILLLLLSVLFLWSDE